MRTLHNIEIVAIIVVVIIGSAAMTAMVVNGLHSSPARASTANTLDQMIKFERHVDDLRYDVQRFDRLLDVMHDEAILLRLVMELGSPQDAVIPSNATCVNDAGLHEIHRLPQFAPAQTPHQTAALDARPRHDGRHIQPRPPRP